MENAKKFLITCIVVNLVYIILGVVLLVINKLNTVSIVLSSILVLVAILSAVLCWRSMYNLNRNK